LRRVQHRPLVFGSVKATVAVAGNALLLTQTKRHPKIVRWAMIAQGALMTWVVVQNARLR
jgi:hypothetical protein